MGEKAHVSKACPSLASLKNVKMSLKARSHKGFGELVNVTEKKDRFGLGYESFDMKRALAPTKNFK